MTEIPHNPSGLSDVLSAGGQLHLVYQPRIDLRTWKVSGVEALVRWRRADGSLQMPDDFIPLAERTGEILNIGAWVLEAAARQAAHWQAMGQALTVAVNVSPLQIDRGALVPLVRGVLKRFGLHASTIELEVTESLCVQHPALASITMRQLQAIGVNLTVDDFGKGYAGVSTLHWLPATALKLDKSLIAGLCARATGSGSLVGALIAFAHRLGAVCVAEGVETSAQLEALRTLDCDLVQGYFFSRPVEPHAIRRDYVCMATPLATRPKAEAVLRGT